MLEFSEADRNYDVLIKANFAGLLTHVMWTGLFIWLNVPILIIANVISCFIYLLCFLLVRREAHYTHYFLVNTQITIQVVLGTIFIGWDAGIHYYIIVILYAAFFFRSIKLGYKLFIVIANTVTYLLLYYFVGSPKVIIDEQLIQILHGINVIAVFGIMTLLSAYYRTSVDRMLQELHELNEELLVMASTDSLTGLLTRRRMHSQLDEAVRTGEEFSLLLLDIDNFKRFNDLYGHECGDQVLLKCANTVKKSLRYGDAVARWGGEEFLILLRNINLEDAEQYAEKMRQTIFEQPVNYKNLQLSVSVTIGVATYDHNYGIEEAINRADQALLSGKANGKNQVEMYSG